MTTAGREKPGQTEIECKCFLYIYVFSRFTVYFVSEKNHFRPAEKSNHPSGKGRTGGCQHH